MCKCPECFSGYFFLSCMIKLSVNLLSHIRSAMYSAFLMSCRMNKKGPALLPSVVITIIQVGIVNRIFGVKLYIVGGDTKLNRVLAMPVSIDDDRKGVGIIQFIPF